MSGSHGTSTRNAGAWPPVQTHCIGAEFTTSSPNLNNELREPLDQRALRSLSPGESGLSYLWTCGPESSAPEAGRTWRPPPWRPQEPAGCGSRDSPPVLIAGASSLPGSCPMRPPVSQEQEPAHRWDPSAIPMSPHAPCPDPGCFPQPSPTPAPPPLLPSPLLPHLWKSNTSFPGSSANSSCHPVSPGHRFLRAGPALQVSFFPSHSFLALLPAGIYSSSPHTRSPQLPLTCAWPRPLPLCQGPELPRLQALAQLPPTKCPKAVSAKGLREGGEAEEGGMKPSRGGGPC